MSERSEAVITSTKETLSGTSWTCLSDFCHFDKMTLSHFWSLGEIIKAYRKLKTIIKRKREERCLTSFWTWVCYLNFSELEKAGLWPNVPAEKMCTWHTMQLSSFSPWAPIGIMFMLWLLSGKCWTLSDICKEIWFPARGYLMTHLSACLASTLWALKVWSISHRYSEITENVQMFSQKPLKSDVWAMPNPWSIIFL